jgi:hypothetical protein
MKSIILASVFISASLSATVGVASADQVCGTLGSHAERPHCGAGMACPMIVTLQYDLTSETGIKYNLETTDPEVLLGLGSLNGNKVCVDGTEESGAIVANSVSAE